MNIKIIDQNRNIEISHLSIIDFSNQKPDFNILSSNELKIIENAKSEKRKIEFFFGRQAAKEALHQLSHIEKNKISIVRGALSEPLIETPEIVKKYQISISHSGHLAAAIASPRTAQLSIDIETTTGKEVPHLKKEQLTTEKENLKQLNLSDEQKFTLCWTAKESLAKIMIDHQKVSMNQYQFSKIDTISENKFLTQFKYFPQYKSIVVFEKNYCFAIGMLTNLNLEF